MSHIMTPSPEEYEAWYAGTRGAWMSAVEARALIDLGKLRDHQTLLDAGCGTGWFTRRFGAAGCTATGVDRDLEALVLAREASRTVNYVCGDMHVLPFPDRCFDAVTAVTSLCFVADERRALRELARVARRQVLLGLLHRRSLLYLRKRGGGGYRGARWHTRAAVRTLVREAGVHYTDLYFYTCLFWPGGPLWGHLFERLPPLKRYGAFLAVRITL